MGEEKNSPESDVPVNGCARPSQAPATLYEPNSSFSARGINFPGNNANQFKTNLVYKNSVKFLIRNFPFERSKKTDFILPVTTVSTEI